MTKQELRKKYRRIRLAVAPRYIEEDSIVICRKVFQGTDWSKIKKVCCYEPIAELKEADIKPLVEAVGYKYPDIKIKILKQSKNQPIPRLKFDLIVVPCLAFDKDNHRLGWGGGFYDKFLARQPQALKIGVCFRSGFVRKGLPYEPHDIPLDKVITEV